jgi:hypothetical protein
LGLASGPSDERRLADLSNVTIGELVNYPATNCIMSGENAYCWPSPPWQAIGSPNPTDPSYGATTGKAGDVQAANTFLKPYQAASFTATQIYRYQTPCANNGDWVILRGPMNIVRTVSQNQDGTWRYDITKDGHHAFVSPLP